MSQRYHTGGKSYEIVDKQTIWKAIDAQHRDFIRQMTENFDAHVVLIKADDRVFFNRGRR